MKPSLTIAFRPGVSLVEHPAQLVLETPRGQLMVNDPPAGLRAALRALAEEGIDEQALDDQVRRAGSAADFVRLSFQLRQYAALGLLGYTLRLDGESLVAVEPMVGELHLSIVPIGADVRCQLSRFVYWRREGDRLVVESPHCRARILLAGPRGAALVAALARPRTAGELSAECPDLSEVAGQVLLGLLASLHLVGVVDEHGLLAEDAAPTLQQWEFHDLLFHARSRQGRHDYPYGATYRFRDVLPPLPALKAPMSDSIVPLYRPDLDSLARQDLPFTEVAERRRSIRTYDERPISARQLGEFLYRVGHVRSVTEIDPAQGRLYAVTSRPYPSGGATYDLELYVAVNVCEDLPAGLYHYDPLAHQLEWLVGRGGPVEVLLRDAQTSAGLAELPQVLITLASRFPRRSWKYAAIAYANTLKNVGVLYQTMYLVATAMGLAPCALGAGSADLFAQVAGTDYYAESSVGEFMLGTAPVT